MKKIIFLLIIFLLISCKNHVVIEQKITKNEVRNNTYLVQTEVWVKNWIGIPIILENWDMETTHISKVDSVKNIQMKIAIEIKKQTEDILND
jgi:2',3'-cyclic-nucleotide 2'-phosphodiesterase (5'-nucleotidase family)